MKETETVIVPLKVEVDDSGTKKIDELERRAKKPIKFNADIDISKILDSIKDIESAIKNVTKMYKGQNGEDLFGLNVAGMDELSNSLREVQSNLENVGKTVNQIAGKTTVRPEEVIGFDIDNINQQIKNANQAKNNFRKIQRDLLDSNSQGYKKIKQLATSNVRLDGLFSKENASDLRGYIDNLFKYLGQGGDLSQLIGFDDKDFSQIIFDITKKIRTALNPENKIIKDSGIFENYKDIQARLVDVRNKNLQNLGRNPDEINKSQVKLLKQQRAELERELEASKQMADRVEDEAESGAVDSIDKIKKAFQDDGTFQKFQNIIDKVSQSLEALGEDGNGLTFKIDEGQITSATDALNELKNALNDIKQAINDFDFSKIKMPNIDETEQALNDTEEHIENINKKKEKMSSEIHATSGDSTSWNTENIQQLISTLENLNTEITNISSAFGRIDTDAGIEPLISQFQSLLSVVNQVSDAIGRFGEGTNQKARNNQKSLLQLNREMWDFSRTTSRKEQQFNVYVKDDVADAAIEANIETEWLNQAERYQAAYKNILDIVNKYKLSLKDEGMLGGDVSDIQLLANIMAQSPKSSGFLEAFPNVQEFVEQFNPDRIKLLPDSKTQIKQIMAFISSIQRTAESVGKGENLFWDQMLELNFPATDFKYISKRIREKAEITKSPEDKQKLKDQLLETLSQTKIKADDEIGQSDSVKEYAQQIQLFTDAIGNLHSVMSKGLLPKDAKAPSFLEQLNETMQKVAENAEKMGEAIQNAFSLGGNDSILSSINWESIAGNFDELNKSITTFQSTISSIDFSSLREGANAIKTEGESAKEAIPYKEEFAKVNKEKVAESGKETAEKIEEAADAIDDENHKAGDSDGSPISPVAVPDDRRLTFGKDIRSIEGYSDANQDFVNQLIADVATGQKEYDAAMDEFKSHITQRQEKLLAERERNTRVNGELLKFTEGAKPILDAMGMAEGELPDGYGGFLDQITKESIKGEAAVRKFAESVGYAFDEISGSWKKISQNGEDILPHQKFENMARLAPKSLQSIVDDLEFQVTKKNLPFTDAIDQFNSKAKELGYTFSEISNMWDKSIPSESPIDDIIIDEQNLEKETTRVASAIRDEFGVKSTKIFGQLKNEVRNLLVETANGKTPTYDNLFDILSRDSGVIESQGDMKLWKQIRSFVSSNKIRISKGDREEFGDDWNNILGTIGIGTLSTKKGSDAISFLGEINESFGHIFDTSTNTQGALSQLYEYLSNPPSGKDDFLSYIKKSVDDQQHLNELLSESSAKITKNTTDGTKSLRDAAKEITNEGDAAEVSEIKKKKFEEANRKVAESGEETADATKKATKGLDNEGKAAERNSDALSEATQQDDTSDDRKGTYIGETKVDGERTSYTMRLGYGEKTTTRIIRDEDGNEFESVKTDNTYESLEKQVISLQNKVLTLDNNIKNAEKQGKNTDAMQTELGLYYDMLQRMTSELYGYYDNPENKPGASQRKDFEARAKESRDILQAKLQQRSEEIEFRQNEKRNKSIENTDALIARQKGNLNNIKAKYVDNAGVDLAESDKTALKEMYNKIFADYFDAYTGQEMPKTVKEELGAAINEYKRKAQQSIKDQKANTQFNPYSIQAGKDKLTTDINDLGRKMQKSGADTSNLENELDSLKNKLSSGDLKSKDLEELGNQLRSIQQRFKDVNNEYKDFEEKRKEEDKKEADENMKEYNEQVKIIEDSIEARNQFNKMLTDQAKGQAVSGDQERAIVKTLQDAGKAADTAKQKIIEMRNEAKITEEQASSALDKYDISKEGSKKSKDDLTKAIVQQEAKFTSKQMDKIQKYHDAAERASNAQDLYNLGEINANQLQRAVDTMEKLRQGAEDAYSTLNKLNQGGTWTVPDSTLDDYRQKMADVDVLKSGMSAFNDNENYEFENVERGYKTLIKYAERYAQINEKQRNGQMLDYSEQAFLNRYGTFYENAINKTGLFVTAQGEASDALKQLRQQFDDTMNEAQTSAFTDSLEEMGEALQKLGNGNWNEDGVRVLQDLNDEFENLVKTSEEYEKASPDRRNQIQNQVLSFRGRLNEAVQQAGGGYYSPADEKDAATLNRRMSEWMYKNSAATEYFPQIQYLQDAINGASAGNLDEIAAAFERIKTQATEAGDVGKSFGETLKGSFKGMARYLLTYADLYEVINIAKQGVNIVRELDTALTEMRKVSDEPLSVLKDFAQHGSFEAADRVGTTSKQILESTADWMRLGESFEQAQKSAEQSTVLLNVSEFQDINAATESLTAMSQAYKDLDKSEIIDKLNYVGNNYAISTSELAESLQKSAGTLQVTGKNNCPIIQKYIIRTYLIAGKTLESYYYNKQAIVYDSLKKIRIGRSRSEVSF